MHTDLTVMYITANLLPQYWVKYQIDILKKAIGDTPIISVSKQPMDLGLNIVETYEHRYWAIYQAMYIAAKEAKTPYVAQAEDDVLYSADHFKRFRPPMNSMSYNRARWSLFTWEDKPMYCLRQRISNSTLIAPRELLIRCLEERFEKWPNGVGDNMTGEIGRSRIDNRLNVYCPPAIEWYSKVPVIHLNHTKGIDTRQRTKLKSHGEIKAYDIPYWGKAKDIVRKFNDE